MPSLTYTFSEFIDRLLVRLYQKDSEESDPVRFFSLLEIAQEFTEPPPEKWVLDAANELRTLGLAAVIINSGTVAAQITGRGRLYVEREQGKTKEIVRNSDKYFHVNVSVNGSHNQIAVGPATQTSTIDHDPGPASKLISEMKTLIRNDQLNEADKSEAISYLDLVEKEVKKQEPNQNILASILEPLSKITSIAGKVAALIQLING